MNRLLGKESSNQGGLSGENLGNLLAQIIVRVRQTGRRFESAHPDSDAMPRRDALRRDLS
ncbi:MAG: hypothetical protein SFZ23_08775 [Planctomycetota bacterium]|nr:hypothetical protein [Planctomycetota bacterium]